MIRFQVYAKDDILNKAVLEKAEQLGYLFGRNPPTKNPYINSKYYIFGYGSESIMSANYNSPFNLNLYPLISLEEFFSRTTIDKVERVEINDLYTAIVSKDQIQVGCFTINKEKLQELKDALQKVSE